MPTSPTVYGLYRTDPAAVEMLASSAGAAKTMRMMFGPAWKHRKLTPAEVQHPWVQAEVAELRAAGVWPEAAS